MNAHTGLMDGAPLTPAFAHALVEGFDGTFLAGNRLAKWLPANLVSADTDAALVAPAVMQRLGSAAGRSPGMRDAIDRHHPVAIALRARLARTPDAVPAPDDVIVAMLAGFREFAKNGNVITIRGVPIPAGAEQVAYYVALRWRPLFSPLADPACVYRGHLAYDAAHCTDEMQESILLVSTRVHRDYLIHLQRTAPAVFVAIWLRHATATERLIARTPVSALPHPYPRSRIGDRRRCLLIACDVMAEHERAFDLLDALKFHGGVTRTSVQAALKSCTAMTRIHAVPDNTHAHVAGAVGHMHAMHATMNATRPKGGVDPILARVRSGFDYSRVYAKQHRPVAWVCGEMPTRYFLGVEPAMLIPVALIHMHESVVRREGQFWLRGARGAKAVRLDALSKRIMHLAIIITSNICPPTARAMMGDDGIERDSLWLRAAIPALVSNPVMQEALDAEAGRRDSGQLHDPATTRALPPSVASGDSDAFKNTYAEARKRARLCSKPMGQPGWTQGFRPDAWRQPLAELDFLRDCCRYVKYDAKLAAKADHWNRVIGRQKMPDGRPVTAADVHTGLPREHPLIRVQEVFRPQFDHLQLAELVRDAELSEAWARREAFIRAIALLLPALSPITDDPYLHERFRIDPKSQDVRIATEGAWNC